MKLRKLLAFCLLALLLAGVAAVLPVTHALAAPEDPTGSYVSDVYPAASAPGMVMVLSLYENNNAEMVSFYFSNPPVIENGTWTQADNGDVTVTWTGNQDRTYDTPGTEVFTPMGGGLMSGFVQYNKLEQVTPADMEAASAGTDSAEADTAATDTAATDTAATDVAAADTMTETAAVSGTAQAAYTVYTTNVYPAADASGLIMLMAFYPNNNMEQLSIYLGKDAIVEVGTWEDTAADTRQVTITGSQEKEYDSPVVTDYTINADGTLSDGVYSYFSLPVLTPADMEKMTSPAGTYSSPLYPAADASGMLTVLSLFDNNNAEQVTIYVAKDTVTEVGTWAQNDDGSIELTITGTPDEAYDQPSVTTYARNGETLTNGAFELTRVRVITPDEMDAMTSTEAVTATEGVTETAATDTADAAGLVGTWDWTETLMSDGAQKTPATPDVFKLSLMEDGSASALTDCNTFAGSYTTDSANQQITIDLPITTMMACPPEAQQDEFIKDLTSVQMYLLQDGNLHLMLPFDSGTISFAPGQAE